VNNSETGITNDLADVISKPSYTSGPLATKINRWFTTSSFTVNAPGTFGNAGRGILSGPGTFNVDLSMQKSVTVRERMTITVRGEAFNSLNHTQLDNPGTTVSSGGFGVITSARDPHIIQLSMKLGF